MRWIVTRHVRRGCEGRAVVMARYPLDRDGESSSGDPTYLRRQILQTFQILQHHRTRPHGPAPWLSTDTSLCRSLESGGCRQRTCPEADTTFGLWQRSSVYAVLLVLLVLKSLNSLRSSSIYEREAPALRHSEVWPAASQTLRCDNGRCRDRRSKFAAFTAVETNLQFPACLNQGILLL